MTEPVNSCCPCCIAHEAVRFDVTAALVYNFYSYCSEPPTPHESTLSADSLRATRNVAFVIAEPWHTTDWTTDLSLLVRSLQQKGHKAAVYCTQIVGPTADYPTHESTVEQMSTPSFWQERGIDTALAFCWLLRAVPVIAALKAAGVFVIARGDSDGLEGMRVHPASQFRRSWHMRTTTAAKWEGV
jgi:hypothetical protein